MRLKNDNRRKFSDEKKSNENAAKLGDLLNNSLIKQKCFNCDSGNKLQIMIGLLHDENPKLAVIFTNKSLTAAWLHFKLSGNGISCSLLNSDSTNEEKKTTIQKIKDGIITTLISTDFALKEFSIPPVSHIYNFDVPKHSYSFSLRIEKLFSTVEKLFVTSLVCETYAENLVEINAGLPDELKLHPVWFDKNYLEIKDFSGNPYDDEGFCSAAFSERESWHDQKRDFKGRDSKRRDFKDRDSNRAFDKKRNNEGDKKNILTNHKKPLEQGQPKPDKIRLHPSKRPISFKTLDKQLPRKTDLPKQTMTKPPNTNSNQGQSIANIFHKIYSAFFGKKKNKD